MKRMTLFLSLAMLAFPAWAQRGGSVVTAIPSLPACTAVTGSCPTNNYICYQSSDNSVHRCVTPSTWTTISGFSVNTSANLATALSDETGTGSAVFGTNPTLDDFTCVDGFVITSTDGEGSTLATSPVVVQNDATAGTYDCVTDGNDAGGADPTTDCPGSPTDVWMTAQDVSTTISQWYTGHCVADTGSAVGINGVCTGPPLFQVIAPPKVDANDLDGDANTTEAFARKPVFTVGEGGVSIHIPEDADERASYGYLNIWLPNRSPVQGRTPTKANAPLFSFNNAGFFADGWEWKGNTSDMPNFSVEGYWKNAQYFMTTDMNHPIPSIMIESHEPASASDTDGCPDYNGTPGDVLQYQGGNSAICTDVDVPLDCCTGAGTGCGTAASNCKERGVGFEYRDRTGLAQSTNHPSGRLAFTMRNNSVMTLGSVCPSDSDGCTGTFEDSQQIQFHGAYTRTCSTTTSIACSFGDDCPSSEYCLVDDSAPGGTAGDDYLALGLLEEPAGGAVYAKFDPQTTGVVKVETPQWGRFLTSWMNGGRGGSGTAILTAFRLREQYFPVPVRFDSVRVHVLSANATATTCSFAIYGDATSAGVVTKLAAAEGAAVATAVGSTGAQTLTLTTPASGDVTINAGVHYVDFICDTAAGSLADRSWDAIQFHAGRTGTITGSAGSLPSTVDLSAESFSAGTASTEYIPWFQLLDSSAGAK